MSKHVDYVRKQANGSPLRFAAMAVGQAVGLTDEELLIGHASIVGRVAARLERYPLRQLSELAITPDPTTTAIRLSFAGSSASVTIMFATAEKWQFDRLILALRNWQEWVRAQRI